MKKKKGEDLWNKKIIAETDRLILRRYRAVDIQDLYKYLSNPKVLEYEPYKPMTMEEAKENLESRIASDEMIAVELKSTGKMIGNVYLGKCDCNSLELGYVFNEDYWHMGYARESCEKLIENAFEHGLAKMKSGGKITIHCKTDRDQIYFIIHNNGKGMTIEELDHLRAYINDGEYDDKKKCREQKM